MTEQVAKCRSNRLIARKFTDDRLLFIPLYYSTFFSVSGTVQAK